MTDAFHRHAIIRHENNQSIFHGIPLLQFIHENAHIIINVFNHTIAGSRRIIVALIKKTLLIFLWSNQWAVRGIKGETSKKRVLIVILIFHPANRCTKEQICTESLGLHDGLVVQKHIVEIFIVGILLKVSKSRLPNTPGTMHEYLMKAPVLR